jgi:hypothetical protein
MDEISFRTPLEPFPCQQAVCRALSALRFIERGSVRLAAHEALLRRLRSERNSSTNGASKRPARALRGRAAARALSLHRCNVDIDGES